MVSRRNIRVFLPVITNTLLASDSKMARIVLLGRGGGVDDGWCCCDGWMYRHGLPSRRKVCTVSGGVPVPRYLLSLKRFFLRDLNPRPTSTSSSERRRRR